MAESLGYASPLSLPRNKLGVRAMVVGIVGLVLAPVVLGGVVGLVALIVGIMAMTRPGKKGAAITGIVTGACAMPVAFIAMFIWLGVIMAMTTMPRLKVAITAGELASIETGLKQFEVDNGRYPTDGEGLAALMRCPAGLAGTWHGPYDGGPGMDAWGRPFVYRGPDVTGSGNFELLSAGPDGVKGTGDDVTAKPGP